MAEKRGDISEKALKIIQDSGVSGIAQKDLEKSLGISKSYCSEVISRLKEKKLILKTGKRGEGATIYLLENYPGKLEGYLRTGLLKSSEYVPAMAFLMNFASSSDARMLFRFYNSTMELLNDLRAGALEFALAPTNSLILSALLSSDLKICSGLSSGGSGIFFAGDWKRDALLSTEVSSMISMSLHVPENGIPEEIETYSDPGEGMKKFLKEKYRAIAIWEPYLHILKEKVEPEKFLDYGSIMDRFPCCSLATTKSYWKHNKDSFEGRISEFANGRISGFENEEFIENAVSEISDTLKLKPEFIRRSMETYDFTSRKISRTKLSELGLSLSRRQEDEIFASGLLV